MSNTSVKERGVKDSDQQLRAQITNKVATLGSQIEAYAVEHSENPNAAKKLVTDTLRRLADSRTVSAADWKPQPVTFDFDAEPPTPDYVIDRTLERRNVGVLGGDTGAAKSIVGSALACAALSYGEWLGRSTHIERVTIIDEENPRRLVMSRLRALGMQNSDRGRLRYFNREGIAIGDGKQTDAWLRAHLDEFRPDLVIVDTLMAACEIDDVNSNSEAVKRMKVLRALAEQFDCAFLVLHHERKQNKDYPSSSSQASLGARQWIGQADAQMTITVESDLIEDDAETEGHTSLRRTFKWRPREKDRDGSSNRPQRVCVASERDTAGRLLWMLVENEGEIDEQASETDALAVSLGSLVQRSEAEMTTAELAAAVGRDAKDGTFKRAITAAGDRGYIEKAKRGIYVAGQTVTGLDV